MPSQFKLVFADWRSRPGRTAEWREQRRANFLTEDAWRREYPETLEDVLLAAEDGPFPHWAIAQCMVEYPFPEPANVAVPRHRYIKFWDQGRMHDAFVGVVLDITRAPYRLVNYVRLMNSPYLMSQAEVTRIHKMYPGPTYVGDDNAAKVIVENLDIPATHFLLGGNRKLGAITATKVALEEGYIEFPGFVNKDNIIVSSTQQLIFELQSYLWKDDGLVQDSVMALSNALFIVGPPMNVYEKPTVKDSRSRTAPITRATGRSRENSRSGPLIAGSSGRRRPQRDLGQMADEYIR